MKIVCHMPLWGRSDITMMSIRSWRAAAKHCDIDLIFAMAISPEDPQYDWFKENLTDDDIYLSECPNQPLSDKFNVATQGVRDIDWDFLVTSGSDQLVSPNWFEHYDYTKLCQGSRDLYFYHNGKFYYYRGYGESRREAMGPGRLFARDLVEICDYDLWKPGVRHYMDKACTLHLYSKGYTIPYQALPSGFYLVDVKSSENLTALDRIQDLLLIPIPDSIREQLEEKS